MVIYLCNVFRDPAQSTQSISKFFSGLKAIRMPFGICFALYILMCLFALKNKPKKIRLELITICTLFNFMPPLYHLNPFVRSYNIYNYIFSINIYTNTHTDTLKTNWMNGNNVRWYIRKRVAHWLSNLKWFPCKI